MDSSSNYMQYAQSQTNMCIEGESSGTLRSI